MLLCDVLGGDCIENAQAGSFLDSFFFSVQTLGLIGYGAIYPTTIYANILVTLEALIGLTGIAIATGLSFARFAQPRVRLIFSSDENSPLFGETADSLLQSKGRILVS